MRKAQLVLQVELRIGYRTTAFPRSASWGAARSLAAIDLT